MKGGRERKKELKKIDKKRDSEIMRPSETVKERNRKEKDIYRKNDWRRKDKEREREREIERERVSK